MTFESVQREPKPSTASWTRRGALLAAMVVTLGVSLWGMDPTAALDALARFRWAYLVPAILASLCVFVARTIRFRFLVDRRVSFNSCMSIVAVGFMAISLVPFRLGELVRPYLLVKVEEVPFGAGLAAVVLERLLDILALLAVLALAGWWVDVPRDRVVVEGVDLLSSGLRVTGTLAVVGGVGTLILAVAGPAGAKLVRRALQPLGSATSDRVGALLASFVVAFRRLLARPKRALGAVLSTVATWLASMLVVYSMLLGFGGLPHSPQAILFNWACTVTAIALIPTPAAIGTFEAGSVASLLVLGADPDRAQIFSLANHAWMSGMTIILGFVFLLREGWSLGSLVRESQKRNAASSVPS